MAFNFGGPLIFNDKTLEIKNYPYKSLLQMADMFLIDLPYGSGFSMPTEVYDQTKAQLKIDGSKFFDILEGSEIFMKNGVE